MVIAYLPYDNENLHRTNCTCGFAVNDNFRIIIHIYPFIDLINLDLIGLRIEEELQSVAFQNEHISFKTIHTAEHIMPMDCIFNDKMWSTKLAGSWGLGINYILKIEPFYNPAKGELCMVSIEKDDSVDKNKDIEGNKTKSLEENILNRLNLI